MLFFLFYFLIFVCAAFSWDLIFVFNFWTLKITCDGPLLSSVFLSLCLNDRLTAGSFQLAFCLSNVLLSMQIIVITDVQLNV